ncbi:hypothetical protein GCM10027215_25350 [Nocardioides zeae]
MPALVHDRDEVPCATPERAVADEHQGEPRGQRHEAGVERRLARDDVAQDAVEEIGHAPSMAHAAPRGPAQAQEQSCPHRDHRAAADCRWAWLTCEA